MARQPRLRGGCGDGSWRSVLVVAAAAGLAVVLLATRGGPDAPTHAHARRGQHGDDGRPARLEPDSAAASSSAAPPPASRTCSTPRAPAASSLSAARTATWRPLVERAAKRGSVDPDVLEAIVMLESAGRPDAQASNDLEGAVGLTQILAETGQNLLGMHIDVRRERAPDARDPARAQGRGAPARAPPRRRALRPGQGARGDRALPADRQASGSAATTSRSPRTTWGSATCRPRSPPTASATSPTRSCSSTRRRCATRGRSGSSPRSATTPRRTCGGSWRRGRSCACTARTPTGSRARPSCRGARRRPRRCCTRRTRRRRSATRSRSAAPARRASSSRLDAAQPRRVRRPRSTRAMGELAGRLHQSPRLYRALRPQALRMLEVIGAGTRAIARTRPARRDEHGARRALPARARRAQHRGDAQLLAAHDRLGVRHLARRTARARRRSRSSSCSTA